MAKRIVAVALLEIGGIYLAVWPHEVGHSLVAYLFGCKGNWWQTGTTWFLFNSEGGRIDYACLRAQGGPALGLTELGGISVNLLLLMLAPVVGSWWRSDLGVPVPRLRWAFVATFVWALANYSEAFSYLVLNTLWLKSDMSTVVAESGISRWIWFAAGCALGALVARLLRKSARTAAASLARPGESGRGWLRGFIIYVVSSSVVMAMARGILR